jgi:ABC-type lipoprotein release transport system permease subunit
MQLALDAPVVLALAAVMCAVAVAASAIPAVRASRQSPAATLRAET